MQVTGGQAAKPYALIGQFYAHEPEHELQSKLIERIRSFDRTQITIALCFIEEYC
jgi:hypothetical protein